MSGPLIIPRRGKEARLIRDLKKGTLRPVTHDQGPQDNRDYVVEFPFLDRNDYPKRDDYHEVMCMIMGRNDNDGFPVALILEKLENEDKTSALERLRLAQGCFQSGRFRWSSRDL
jgi:hypothetical protein